MKKIIPSILVFFMIVVALFASAESMNLDKIEEGKRLARSQARCEDMNEGQLEAIGEYLMEQMHPGSAHEAAHRMMGLEEGTLEHEKFHVNLTKSMYCGAGDWGMLGVVKTDLFDISMMKNYLNQQNMFLSIPVIPYLALAAIITIILIYLALSNKKHKRN